MGHGSGSGGSLCAEEPFLELEIERVPAVFSPDDEALIMDFDDLQALIDHLDMVEDVLVISKNRALFIPTPENDDWRIWASAVQVQ